MPNISITWEDASQRRFDSIMSQSIFVFGNIRPELSAVGSHFYRSNNRQFNLNPGKYADLRDTYKEWKQGVFGFVYPILVGTGALADSLTNQRSANTIYELTNTSLTIGSKVQSKKGAPYPFFIHAGYKARDGSRVPARPLLPKDESDLKAYKRIFWQTLQKRVNRVWSKN